MIPKLRPLIDAYVLIEETEKGAEIVGVTYHESFAEQWIAEADPLTERSVKAVQVLGGFLR